MILTESSGMYVTDMVDFADQFAAFTLTIEKAVVYHYDFWRELLEPTPEILKLDLLAMKITNIITHIENMYKDLIALNSNNIKCNLLYGEFQKQILNDDTNSQELIDKALAFQKNILGTGGNKSSDKKSKYGQNADTVIINLSGNETTMGLLMNINSEVYRLLGYKKHEILGNNVKMLMPKIFADNHHNFIAQFFDRAEGKAINTERHLAAMDKEGYVFLATLLIKFMPDLSKGIQIIGLMKEKEEFMWNVVPFIELK